MPRPTSSGPSSRSGASLDDPNFRTAWLPKPGPSRGPLVAQTSREAPLERCGGEAANRGPARSRSGTFVERSGATGWQPPAGRGAERRTEGDSQGPWRHAASPRGGFASRRSPVRSRYAPSRTTNSKSQETPATHQLFPTYNSSLFKARQHHSQPLQQDHARVLRVATGSQDGPRRRQKRLPNRNYRNLGHQIDTPERA